MLKTYMALALSACVMVPTGARDLGVQGQIWPITEIDIRQLLMESASRADVAKAQAEVVSSTDAYFDNLPVRRLPSAEKTVTHLIDPSITTQSDISAPVANEAGDYQWVKLHPKGIKVNPLAVYRPLTAMLFFDGNSEAQLKFVREALAANPMRIVPVETAGANVKKLSMAFDRPIFYANEAMLARFNVAHLPSLLYPASGQYSLYLGMTAFAEPYKYAELETVWPKDPPHNQGVLAAPPVTDVERNAISNLLKNPLKAATNAKDM